MAGWIVERARLLAGPIGLAFLPAEGQVISAADRAAVESFVRGQVDNLSSINRRLLGLGLWVFQAGVWRRYGRGFLTLEAAEQRAAVARWAYGRWSLARHVMRVFRTTSLFCYFELPVVRYQLAALGGGIPARPRRSAGTDMPLPVPIVEERL